MQVTKLYAAGAGVLAGSAIGVATSAPGSEPYMASLGGVMLVAGCTTVQVAVSGYKSATTSARALQTRWRRFRDLTDAPKDDADAGAA